MSEVLIEKGRVVRVNKEVEIELIETEKCDKCSFIDHCKTKLERRVILPNKFNLKTGQEVLLEVKGSDVLILTCLLYGVPLILFLVSIFSGFFIFEKFTELYSTAFGLTLVGIYYLTVKKVLQNKFDKIRFNIKIAEKS